MAATNRICELCKETKRGPDKTPETFVTLPNTTERKGLSVTVCPHCDGGTLEYAKKHST